MARETSVDSHLLILCSSGELGPAQQQHLTEIWPKIVEGARWRRGR